MSADDGFRKRAPGTPDSHPDWVLSMSGGINSTAAALVAHRAIETRQAGGNFAKKPFALYLDTGVGVPLNRLYVEQLCDWLEVQLWTLRTDESFLDWLRGEGAPGPPAHRYVKDKLKDRQASLLSAKLANPFFILGFSAYESDARAALPKIRRKRRHVEVYPVHRVPEKKQVELILRSGCPLNLLWLYPNVIQDCGCFANGDPSEVDATVELFPEFGQRLREWEEAITHDGLKAKLGWGGLAPGEKSAIEAAQEQLQLCSDDCQRMRDPAIVRAIRARVNGSPVEEAVSILYADEPVEAEQPATVGLDRFA